MICFDHGTRRFAYRIVGVAIHDGSVLLHRANGERFWTLPGGRAEHGETAEQTLQREMREELETDVHVLRLLWLVENFFDYEGLSCHEIALYFLMEFPEHSLPLASTAFDRTDAGVLLRFEWHPVQATALVQLPLLPGFLSQALTELPASVVHIVQRDSAPPESLLTNAGV
jgi:ADP-ribose pyrophosphatase YjhB (NUDIX family)